MSFKNTPAVATVNKAGRSKTLLSVAVGLALGVVASPELFAADEAALKVYGRAHASVDYVDNGDEGDFNVASNSSRIGVAGSTELAEGIRGILCI